MSKTVFNPFTGNFDITENISELVTGPASAIDNAITRFDSTTGKLIKNSSASVSDSGVVTAGADAVSSLDLVTKQQLDAAIGGVDVKEGALVATTGDIVLLGEQTIDGVLTSSNRVLVKAQSIPSQNGIYISNSGAWTRALDADSTSDLNDALVCVESGSTFANTGWRQVTIDPVIGVDSVVWNQFFGAGTYTADGQGIELSGSTFQLELDGTTLSKSSSGVKVASGGVTNTEVNASAAIAYSKLALSNSVVNADVNSSAAIAYSKLNLTGNIVNADISSGAGIAISKLSTISNGAIIVGNGSGIPTAVIPSGDISISNSGVTSYAGTVSILRGGTGQTSKAPAFDALSPMSASGDIIYGGASGTGTRLPKGSDGQFLALASGVPAWTAPPAGYLPTASKTSAYNAVNGDYVLCDSSGGTFAVTLPTATAGHRVAIKKTDTSFILVTIVGTIDGVSGSNVATQNEVVELIADGTNWHTVNRRIPSVWTSWTMTCTQTTNATITSKWKREGQNIRVSGRVGYTGATDNANPVATFPSTTITMDTSALLDTSGGNSNLGIASYSDTGVAGYSGRVSYVNSTSVEMQTLKVDGTYGNYTGSTHLVPFTVANGDKLIFEFVVPITNWKG